MRQLAGKLTYSRVVSTVALFVALGGSAYAIGLGNGDVNSRIIKNDTVKSADVKNDGLKGKDILEATLDTAEFTAARSSGNASCDPELIYVSCGSVTLQTPVAGRILAMASGELVPEGPQASGACQLEILGAAQSTLARFPEQGRGMFGFELSGVSEVVAPGSHTIELQCVEAAGELMVGTHGLSAVLVGAG